MTVFVELHTRRLADVTLRPSWWRRLFLFEREQTRIAAFGPDGVWTWDDDGRLVPDDVAEALTIAAFVSNTLRPLRTRT